MSAAGQERPAAEQESAAAAATAAFAARQGGQEFYRQSWDGLTVASIGLGTYLGDPDAATDERYAQAVRRYLELGGNLVDTAINYRFQRGERAVGAALGAAMSAGEMDRDEVVVCSKGGYLSFDGQWPADPERWTRETFIDTGIVQPEEIVDGQCLAPAYLRHEIERSRQNLGVARIDLYYLHNPEAQRAAVGEELFHDRLREAFATLEVAVAQGLIGAYGVATWNGLRARPGAPDYLALKTLIETAQDVAGERHHFRAVEVPVNLQMLEAIGRANQPGQAGLAPLLAVAAEHDVAVIASASLLQGNVIGRLPDSLRAKFEPGLSDAQRALQFVRSSPGVSAALVGMSRVEHVEENMGLKDARPMRPETWRRVFQE